MLELSYIGRRVLGHLPVWAQDETAHIEAEGGPESSIRAYSLADFSGRLAEDAATPSMSGEEVAAVLGELAAQGLCEQASDGWRMTQEGFETLTDPTIREGTSQEFGPAFIETHSAALNSQAQEA